MSPRDNGQKGMSNARNGVTWAPRNKRDLEVNTAMGQERCGTLCGTFLGWAFKLPAPWCTFLGEVLSQRQGPQADSKSLLPLQGLQLLQGRSGQWKGVLAPGSTEALHRRLETPPTVAPESPLETWPV